MNKIEGFGDRLLKAIGDKDLSNRKVGALTGIPTSCINLYVNGNQLPNCSNLVKLAKVLGVSTDWLLGVR